MDKFQRGSFMLCQSAKSKFVLHSSAAVCVAWDIESRFCVLYLRHCGSSVAFCQAFTTCSRSPVSRKQGAVGCPAVFFAQKPSDIPCSSMASLQPQFNQLRKHSRFLRGCFADSGMGVAEEFLQNVDGDLALKSCF